MNPKQSRPLYQDGKIHTKIKSSSIKCKLNVAGCWQDFLAHSAQEEELKVLY